MRKRNGMKVYSLTGKRGTGKSYQAQALCHRLGIDALIDDGLFISQNSIKAGISAKRQKTIMGAIRVAIFEDEEKAQAVREAIKAVHPNSVLILGTSEKMTSLIAERLGIGPVDTFIHIEDITTAEERETAERQRVTEGKHVIPVPTLQLKQDFAGYFLDPMKIWRLALSTSEQAGEDIHKRGFWKAFSRPLPGKTVVRPTYSYLGDFFISTGVLEDIAGIVGEEETDIAAVGDVFTNADPERLNLRVSLELKAGADILLAAKKYQRLLAEKIGEMTAFNIDSIDVAIRRIV